MSLLCLWECLSMSSSNDNSLFRYNAYLLLIWQSSIIPWETGKVLDE